MIEQHADGGVVARVSVFSDGAEPSPTEITALEGDRTVTSFRIKSDDAFSTKRYRKQMKRLLSK